MLLDNIPRCETSHTTFFFKDLKTFLYLITELQPTQ